MVTFFALRLCTSVSLNLFINITHPYDDNYTYNFSENLTGPYYLDLNLTYNYNPGSWLYSLYDLKHNKWVYQDVSFVPNFTQVGAVRWGNRLDVFASTLDGQKNATDNVTFFIWVKNTAPIIGPIDNPVYACESTSLCYNSS